MKLGCHLPTMGASATREALLAFCREAEARDVPSLWVSDHVIFPRTATGRYPGGRFPWEPDTPYLEPVAVLAAAAVATTKARLGSSVFILGHRHPVVMAKMLTTIEELWTSDNPRFEGEFYRFSDVGFAPKPVQKPHPPIWVGGDSPGALRRVVALGDGWHATSKPPEELAKSLVGLRAAAEAGHRPFETIELSVRVALRRGIARESRQAVVDQLSGYKRLGLTHVMLDFRRDTLGEMLEILDLVTRELRPAVDRA